MPIVRPRISWCYGAAVIQSRQVEAFRAVMLTGAMTAAAERLHVSQPAVSRLIRDLEAELGFPLFHRRGNVVEPTAQAHALQVEVERAFVGLEQIRAFAEGLRTGQGGWLRVAALPAVAAGFLPRFVAGFSRERPQLRLLVDGLPSLEVRSRVAAGQVDVGIVAYPFQDGSLVVTPLEDGTVVALPEGHRLAGRAVVSADDLREERLVLLSRFATGRHPIDVALQSASRRQPVETPLATVACVLVQEGMGVAVVDAFSASEFVGKGLVLRRFEPPWAIGTALVHSGDRALSSAAQEFHDAFRRHARSFLRHAGFLRTDSGT